jgi:uncharacterized OB-fold protein
MGETISPAINTLNQPFWSAAEEGRLVLPFCVLTGRFFWPPASLSPFVGGSAIEWREAATSGVLVTRVVYRRAFQQPLKDRMPYAVGLVALDDGPRLLAHIPDPDRDDSAQSGDPVRIVFVAIVEGGPSVPHAVRSPRV